MCIRDRSASKIISFEASKVMSTPSMSTSPSAVIVKFAAAAEASVVTKLVAPLAATVVTKVSPEEPVIVITLPSIATSSTVSAVRVPSEVTFP